MDTFNEQQDGRNFNRQSMGETVRESVDVFMTDEEQAEFTSRVVTEQEELNDRDVNDQSEQINSPDYPRITYKRVTLDIPGVAKGLQDLLFSSPVFLVYPNSEKLVRTEMLTETQLEQFEMREKLNKRVYPTIVYEETHEMSEQFKLSVPFSRPISWDGAPEQARMFPVPDLMKFELRFQTGTDVFQDYQLKYGCSMWILSPEKLPLIGRVTNTNFLEKKCVLIFIRYLHQVCGKEPRGNYPEIWNDLNNKPLPINSRMVKMRALAYFANSDVNKNKIDSFTSIQKLWISHVGNLTQFLRYLRMVSIPDRPISISAKNDYNVSVLYDALIEPTFFKTEQYSNNEHMPAKLLQKFNEFMATPGPVLLMVDGGPGTGKTYSLCDCINNLFANTAYKGKLLICAPSNAAIDVITIKLMTLLSHKQIWRIGREGKINAVVFDKMKTIKTKFEQKFVPDYTAENGMPPSESQIKQALIKSSDVLCATLGATQMSEFSKLQDITAFDTLIVDECGQAKMVELLLPLHIHSIQRLMLVGDPLQLGPTFTSPIVANLPASETLVFANFCKKFINQRSKCIHRLRDQFRMRPLVAANVNMISYPEDDQLVTPNAAHAKWMVTKCLPPTVVFSGESWEENKSMSTYSKYNLNEAEFGVALIQELMEFYITKNPNQARKITYAIICLYREQVVVFRRLLRKANLGNDVGVFTVDEMQGSEAHVVIVSAVRGSNDHENIGFAEDIRRLNVALSRGSCVYVLARHDMFHNKEGWNSLMTKAVRLGIFCPYADSLLRHNKIRQYIADISSMNDEFDTPLPSSF